MLKGFKLSTKIYIVMLLLVFTALFITGGVTLSFFKKQNEDYHFKRLQRKEETVVNAIQYFFKEFQPSQNLDVVDYNFEKEIFKLADINGVDINVFNTAGDLLISSYLEKDENYYKTAISKEDLKAIYSKNETVVNSVSVGEKAYMSIFSFLYNDKKEKVAIINIPNYDFSKTSIDYNEFFKTLVEVYLFLFVGAIIFSFFLSRYITSSLRLIGEKLKAIKLNKENTKLIWSSNDEIGELVNQYNLMIDHVERSATLLAQSERESAWREMAKQVAHEIKNPLTPMKLNVQHLERSLNPNSDDFQERLALFSERMIRQIDSLAFIANEFSNFAKMPQAQFSQIDLLKKVEASIEIFKNEEYASIEFEKKMDKAIINGDKAQILRVFNNLLKNAIQSMDISKKGIIHVLITEEKGYYIVSIKDTGKGIPKENYDKIFVPNFTTKTSGSGLGLAMVKNIIENHKGQIWFESQVDKGTTFYMKFPMLNS